MLDQHGDLAIAILVFYVLGLPIAVYVCFRHGFGRQLGWLYLILLPVARILGAILLLAAENITPVNIGLYIGAAILSSVGFVPLLLCFMGLLQRVNNGQRESVLNQQFFRITHLILLAGLALSIAGGIMIEPTNSSSDISTGNTLRKVAAILLLVGWLISTLMNVLFMGRIRYVWGGDRPLVYFGLLAQPFLLVRLVYLIAISFSTANFSGTGGGMFNVFSPNVWVQAFMQVAMEFIVFILFVTAGLITPGIKNTPETSSDPSRSLPGQRNKYGDTELGTIPARR